MPVEPSIYVVLLRRPELYDPREDPFWEFGSFGCTGCHARNLLSPNSSGLRDGDRLAFAQGGDRGTRLVLLTPPVRVAKHRDALEIMWDASVSPFRYSAAPVFAGNEVKSDFPAIRRYVAACKRPTDESKFASKFRGRTMALEPELAAELTKVFNRLRSHAGADSLAKTYTQTMPWFLDEPDRHRWRTYQQLRKEIGAHVGARRCASRSCRS